MGGFTAVANQYWAGYHVVIAYGLLLLIEILFLPETLYPRDLVIQKLASGQGIEDIQRTRMIKVWVRERYWYLTSQGTQTDHNTGYREDTRRRASQTIRRRNTLPEDVVISKTCARNGPIRLLSILVVTTITRLIALGYSLTCLKGFVVHDYGSGCIL